MSLIKINKFSNIIHIVIDNFYENFTLYKNTNYFSFLTFNNNECLLYNFRDYNDFNFLNNNHLNYLLICSSNLLNNKILKKLKINKINSILNNCFYYFLFDYNFNLLSYDTILKKNKISLNYKVQNKKIQLKTNNIFFKVINNIYLKINYVKDKLKKEKKYKDSQLKYNFNYLKYNFNKVNNLIIDKNKIKDLIINIKNNIKYNFTNSKIQYLKSNENIPYYYMD